MLTDELVPLMVGLALLSVVFWLIGRGEVPNRDDLVPTARAMSDTYRAFARYGLYYAAAFALIAGVMVVL